jgi:hypothetical protein
MMAYHLRTGNREPDLERAEQTARKQLRFCVRDSVNNDVIEKAFCSYLAAHPDKLPEMAIEVFGDAMAETWPVHRAAVCRGHPWR